MSEVIEGVIHGRSIVLEADPGLADGQRVKVRIEPEPAAPAEPRRELPCEPIPGSVQPAPEERTIKPAPEVAPLRFPFRPVPDEDEGKVYTPLTDPALIELLATLRRGRRPLPPSPTGPGRKSTAGMLANDPEWDEHMAEIERERRADFGREVS